MRTRFFAAAALALVCGAPRISHAQQIATRAVDVRTLPREVAYAGRVVAARRWTDRMGENVVLLTQSGPLPVPQRVCAKETGSLSDPCRRGEVYAYHYRRRGAGRYALLWRTFDSEPACAFDLTAGFEPGSLSVTDLDRDGVAETSFLYVLACRSDVSPAVLKLIMHEGAAKYAIRGTTRPKGAGAGGEMAPDRAFRAAPPAFLAFARRQWARFVPEDRFMQT
jgi:hypothetical protein